MPTELEPTDDDEVVLRPGDPFDRILIQLVKMNRRKRADYASAENVISNFQFNSDLMYLAAYDSFADCYTMVTRKIGRIQNLMSYGATPQNESLQDSLIDLAVYSVLLILCYEDSFPHG